MIERLRDAWAGLQQFVLEYASGSWQRVHHAPDPLLQRGGIGQLEGEPAEWFFGEVAGRATIRVEHRLRLALDLKEIDVTLVRAEPRE